MRPERPVGGRWRRAFRGWLAASAAVLAGCAPATETVANLDSVGTRLVVYGDSLTAGYGIDPAFAFPAVLEHELGVPVVAEGQVGATSADGVAQFRQRVPRHDPFLVVLEFGGNDFRHRMPVEETAGNMGRMVAMVQGLGAVAVVASIDVDPIGDRYGKAYTGLAGRMRAGVVTGLLDDVLGKPRYMVDPIHPNAEGHALLAARVLRGLRPILEGMPSGRRARPAG